MCATYVVCVCDVWCDCAGTKPDMEKLEEQQQGIPPPKHIGVPPPKRRKIGGKENKGVKAKPKSELLLCTACIWYTYTHDCLILHTETSKVKERGSVIVVGERPTPTLSLSPPQPPPPPPCTESEGLKIPQPDDDWFLNETLDPLSEVLYEVRTSTEALSSISEEASLLTKNASLASGTVCVSMYSLYFVPCLGVCELESLRWIYFSCRTATLHRHNNR